MERTHSDFLSVLRKHSPRRPGFGEDQRPPRRNPFKGFPDRVPVSDAWDWAAQWYEYLGEYRVDPAASEWLSHGKMLMTDREGEWEIHFPGGKRHRGRKDEFILTLRPGSGRRGMIDAQYVLDGKFLELESRGGFVG